MLPAARTIVPTSPEAAASLAVICRYLDAQSGRPGHWAIAGPGVHDFVERGRIDPQRLRIIAGGADLVTAERMLRRGGGRGVEPFLESARQARVDLGLPIDATWTRGRLLDRPDLARACRLTLARSTRMVFVLTGGDGDWNQEVRVAHPFDAYLIELARFREAPRKSPARQRAAERAADLYRAIGAETIEHELQRLVSLAAEPRMVRSRMGLHHDDAQVAYLWHRSFMRRDRVTPGAALRARAERGLHRFVRWAGAEDMFGPGDRDFP